MFLIQFYKFVLFLKSITKLVKHCNKNDEIKKHVLLNWKRPFRGKTEQRNCYMGPIWCLYGLFWANPYGYAHIGPKWNRCRHTHVGLPRMVPDGSHITALLEKYEFICMYLFPT